MKELLTKIAKETRKWAENLYNHRHLLGNKDWYQGLAGMCAICSVELADRLKKEGFSPSIAKNGNHTFVICDGYLIDITATQFGQKRNVTIIKHTRMPKQLYWETNEVVEYTSFEKASELFKDWPKSQQPDLGIHITWHD